MDQRQRKQWTRAMKGSRRVWRRKDRTRGWVTTKGGQCRISGAENKQSWLGRSSLPQSTGPALLARAKPKGTKPSYTGLDSCDWGKYVNPEELASADHCALKRRPIRYSSLKLCSSTLNSLWLWRWRESLQRFVGDFRFWRIWLRRLMSSEKWRRVVWQVVTDMQE